MKVETDVAAPTAARACPRRLSALLAGIAAAFLVFAAPALADIAPTVAIAPPTAISAEGAHLSGTVDPEGGPSTTSWQLQYSRHPETEGWSVAGAGSFEGTEGEETVPLPVATDLIGLQPGVTYQVRLTATNEGGEGLSAEPNPTFTTLAAAPLIETSGAADVSSSAADLTALIDPGGAETGYRFEYGTDTGYGTSLPVPDGDLGAGDSAIAVTRHLQGLAPATTYHFRVVAHNSMGTIPGPDRTFTTSLIGAGFSLPDGREWELVTPVDKLGAGLKTPPAEGGLIEASSDGGALTYFSSAPPVAGAQGNRSLESVQNLAWRGPAGWSSQTITSPNTTLGEFIVGDTSEYKLFSGDLATALVVPPGETALPPLAEGAEKTIYLRDSSSGAFEPLVSASNVPPGEHFGRPRETLSFRGASSDLGHVVLSSVRALSEELAAPTAQENLYEWAAGRLHLISVLPDGRPAAEPGVGSEPETAALGHRNRLVRNAISADGTRVVWQTTGIEPRLFLRDAAAEETVQLDVPQQGVGPPSESDPVFEGANADDSRIFFRDIARLTTDSQAQSGAPDLYVAEVGPDLTVSLTDLSADPVPGESAAVQGLVLGYSTDGSSVYYVADGALTPGALPGGCGEGGSPGTFCNVYLAALGPAGWRNRLVARVSIADWTDWGGPGEGSPAVETSRVSPDGRYLALMSRRPLTGYDNEDLITAEPDQELFLFDAVGGGLRCVSCNPTGARPRGLYDAAPLSTLESPLVDPGRLWREQTLAASVVPWTPTALEEGLYQPRYLSDSGRLFFNGADGLVPADVNRREDVYQYEPEGAPGGECSAATQSAGQVYRRETETEAEPSGAAPASAAGCLALISSGTGAEESAFLDASESGEDVFFLTADRLVGEDADTAFDIYDAHRCSASSPCPPSAATTPPPCASVESCHGALALPGPGTEAGSARFQGDPGNPPNESRKRAAALRRCRKSAPRKQRVACERRVKKRFGSPKGRAGSKKGAKR